MEQISERDKVYMIKSARHGKNSNIYIPLSIYYIGGVTDTEITTLAKKYSIIIRDLLTEILMPDNLPTSLPTRVLFDTDLSPREYEMLKEYLTEINSTPNLSPKIFWTGVITFVLETHILGICGILKSLITSNLKKSLKQKCKQYIDTYNHEIESLITFGTCSLHDVHVDAGILLYRSGKPGVERTYYDRLKWFGYDIQVAKLYMPPKEYKNTNMSVQKLCKQFNKIYVYKTLRPLNLINMSSIYFVKTLRDQMYQEFIEAQRASNTKEIEIAKSNLKALHRTWRIENNKLYRNSNVDDDIIVGNYICHKGYDGYLAKSMKTQNKCDFHNEIMLCNSSATIELVEVIDSLPYYCDYDIPIPLNK